MKPVIITLNSDNNVVMSVDEFRRHMDSAYNQGWSDGNSSLTTISTTPYYGNQRWWTDVTCNATDTAKCSTNALNIENTCITGSYTKEYVVDNTQMTISDYIKSKEE